MSAQLRRVLERPPQSVVRVTKLLHRSGPGSGGCAGSRGLAIADVPTGEGPTTETLIGQDSHQVVVAYGNFNLVS